MQLDAPTTSRDHNAAADIRANLDRLAAIWQAMVDEPQDPQVAERIAMYGKRTDKD